MRRRAVCARAPLGLGAGAAARAAACLEGGPETPGGRAEVEIDGAKATQPVPLI